MWHVYYTLANEDNVAYKSQLHKGITKDKIKALPPSKIASFKGFNDDGILHYVSRYCTFTWKSLLLLKEWETTRGLNKMAEWHQAGKGTVLGDRWETVGSFSSPHSRVFQVTF